MTDDPHPVIFRRRDPARNMARFYVLALERTLWGTYAVVRSYGRIGAFGRTHAEHFATRGEAEVHRMRLAAAKMRRGYRPVSAWAGKD